MRPPLKLMISQTELAAAIARGDTLQSILDEVQRLHGHKYSTAYLSKMCREYGIQCPRSGPRSGSLHKGWRGGRILSKDGYVEVYVPGHPRRRKHTPYMLEHRLVMEAHLGRLLDSKEVVHHKNGVTTDNRIENLEVFRSNAEHLRATLKGKLPRWTEEGLAKIRAAHLGKKRTNFCLSDEKRQARRVQCLLRNSIRRELKLGVLPNKEFVLRCLEQHGISHQLASERALKREPVLSAVDQSPTLQRETAP